MTSFPAGESLTNNLVSRESGSTEQQVSRVFQALSNPTRRAILRCLTEGPRSVSEIVEQFTLTQPTISRHLGLLSEAGLVLRRRLGQRVVYRLNEQLVLEAGSIPLRGSRRRRDGRKVAPW